MVYKYYSPQQYNFDALQNGYFFFCKVSKLNDPFDTNLKLLQGLPQEYADHAILTVREYATCSFSRRADNLSLWALYAQSYTGFAVGYDETMFEDLIRKYSFRFIFHDVFYVDAPLDVSNPETAFPSWNYEGEHRMVRLKECINDQRKRDALYIYMAFMKEAKVWANEEEYRAFVGKDILKYGAGKEGIRFEDNGYKVDMPKGTIKSIIIGHNMCNENRQLLLTQV